MKALCDFPQAIMLLLAISLLALALPLKAEQMSSQENSQVMQAFTSSQNQNQEQSDANSTEDQTKHLVMFVMGVPLLILLLITGGLGIAMGVYGKQVFVAHMICAGLSMTLAVAHAIVGLVWFNPF
jgi:hypothetical protein